MAEGVESVPGRWVGGDVLAGDGNAERERVWCLWVV